MNPDEIMLVRQGFDRIAPMAEQVGVALYHRLFAFDPSLRALFRGDILTHARNIMAALATVVRSLDDLSPILDQLDALGRRHGTYGVQPHHFATAGAALLATLEAELGEAFTPDARAAWTRAYQTLAGALSAALQPA